MLLLNLTKYKLLYCFEKSTSTTNIISSKQNYRGTHGIAYEATSLWRACKTLYFGIKLYSMNQEAPASNTVGVKR